jgi:hypothetical protein
MTDKNEYESAWAEGTEEAAETAGSKMVAAKKASDASEKDAYITAYADIDAGQSVNGETLKDVKPKDKSQEDGTIVAKKGETK